MAYIISVNASILADSGGTCVCPATSTDLCASDAEYGLCLNELQRDLITATAAAACLASFLMGLFANIPVGLAPGLGLNAYFAYSIVGYHGSGNITFKEALAAVFLEGWIFFALSILGVRQWLARSMPHSLVMAVGAGIGMFIAFIGLSSSGLFVIGGDVTNLVGLGGCKSEDTVEGMTNFCESHVLQDPRTWLGIFVGGMLTVFLMLYRVRGSILIGIFLVAIISWPRDTAVTYFPRTDSGDDLKLNAGAVNGNVGGVIVGNTPALSGFHRSLSMEYEEVTATGSPIDAKFTDRTTITPSPEVAAYPPRKFA
ncbi:hypothetical protein A7U60_g1241 [Sanghuangporus baumii]|uniref:Xanthine/uracil permease n=1 Tax=Sanghuangporus baumii TaxID=108892 RepID=A0A9Q5I4Q8_SANBA|nr:hypothetical protein A7U60_g1241 [Sanghuangporus baumii]